MSWKRIVARTIIEAQITPNQFGATIDEDQIPEAIRKDHDSKGRKIIKAFWSLENQFEDPKVLQKKPFITVQYTCGANDSCSTCANCGKSAMPHKQLSERDRKNFGICDRFTQKDEACPTHLALWGYQLSIPKAKGFMDAYDDPNFVDPTLKRKLEVGKPNLSLTQPYILWTDPLESSFDSESWGKMKKQKTLEKSVKVVRR